MIRRTYSQAPVPGKNLGNACSFLDSMGLSSEILLLARGNRVCEMTSVNPRSEELKMDAFRFLLVAADSKNRYESSHKSFTHRMGVEHAGTITGTVRTLTFLPLLNALHSIHYLLALATIIFKQK